MPADPSPLLTSDVGPTVVDGGHGWRPTLALDGGATARVRRMEPDDDTRLARFHSRLSLDTTRLRFFSVHPHLTPLEITRFTQVDHHHREALVAVVDDELVAVARYERLPGGAPAAEVAVVVEDRWQGNGLGTLLVEDLASLARGRGITTFEADVLVENRPMLAVFRRLAAAPLRARADGALVRLEIPLMAGGGPLAGVAATGTFGPGASHGAAGG